MRGKSIDDVRMHREIGYLPEQPYFYDYLTARELLDYYARLFGFGAADRRERVTRFLDRVGLADAGDLQLRKFSKGMLQRVGIAQAILHDPQAIFLDEPMSGLDPVGRREVRDIIHDLSGRPHGVLFHPYPFGCGDVVRPGGSAGWRKIAGRGSAAEIVSMQVYAMEILFETQARRALPARSLIAPRKSGGAIAWKFRKNSSYAALERTAKLRGSDSFRDAVAADAGGLFLQTGRAQQDCVRSPKRRFGDECDTGHRSH